MKTKLSISYICVGDLCPVHVYSLVGDFVTVSFCGPRLVASVALLEGFLSPLGHFYTWPQTPQALTDVWLWVSACVSTWCWVEPLRGSCLQA